MKILNIPDSASCSWFDNIDTRITIIDSYFRFLNQRQCEKYYSELDVEDFKNHLSSCRICNKKWKERHKIDVKLDEYKENNPDIVNNERQYIDRLETLKRYYSSGKLNDKVSNNILNKVRFINSYVITKIFMDNSFSMSDKTLDKIGLIIGLPSRKDVIDFLVVMTLYKKMMF